MRLRSLRIASFVLLLAGLWFGLFQMPAAFAEQEPVDLELVLAVDVSRSMDVEEQLLQRRGYVEAFRSKEVIDAILEGGYGRIAVLYMEWAGVGITNIVVPWTLIDSADAAAQFSDLLNEQQPRRLSRTSISNALMQASSQFRTSQWRGLRRVIDVSGDGPNNQGIPVNQVRDDAVADGIIINGLPLMIRTSSYGFGIEHLDAYYFDCVIGGTGSFVIPVYDWEEFPLAVRRKLVLEITNLETAGKPVPVAAETGSFDDPTRKPADCLVGEKQWDMRMRDMEWR